jgi:hypothetical protein
MSDVNKYYYLSHTLVSLGICWTVSNSVNLNTFVNQHPLITIFAIYAMIPGNVSSFIIKD